MAGNALAVIRKETERLQKAHPRMSFRAAQKKAGKNYRSGAVRAKKKHHKKAHTKKRVRKHSSRKRARKRSTRTVVVVSGTHAIARAKVTRKRRKRRATYKVTHRVRRVSGTGRGISTTNMLLFGGLLIGAYLLLKPKSSGSVQLPGTPPAAPPLQLTGNTTRDTQAQQIIAWATAGGMAVDAVIKLINTLNTKPDTQVSAVYDSINTGGGVPGWALI